MHFCDWQIQIIKWDMTHAEMILEVIWIWIAFFIFNKRVSLVIKEIFALCLYFNYFLCFMLKISTFTTFYEKFYDFSKKKKKWKIIVLLCLFWIRPLAYFKRLPTKINSNICEKVASLGLKT